jgi:hypothetical protein
MRGGDEPAQAGALPILPHDALGQNAGPEAAKAAAPAGRSGCTLRACPLATCSAGLEPATDGRREGLALEDSPRVEARATAVQEALAGDRFFPWLRSQEKRPDNTRWKDTTTRSHPEFQDGPKSESKNSPPMGHLHRRAVVCRRVSRRDLSHLFARRPAGTKRLGNLPRSKKWSAALIAEHLWEKASGSPWPGSGPFAAERLRERVAGDCRARPSPEPPVWPPGLH